MKRPQGGGRPLWRMAILMSVGLTVGCAGGRSTPEAASEARCEASRGPTEVEDVEGCSLTCDMPVMSARCEGPRGRPVACACTSGDEAGRRFALARCEALDVGELSRRCRR
jgi:hypothetical protein